MANPKTTPTKRRRLGKGLHAMVEAHTNKQETDQNTNKIKSHTNSHNLEEARPPELAGGRVADIGVDAIEPNRHQPRKQFDDEALSALADSIRAVGVIQPIIVRRAAGPGRYELIAGERRWRASKLAGLATIPAIVRESDERTAAEAALIENLQREDLNPIERSEGLRGLIERFGLTQQEAASRVGLDRSSVANLLRLHELEPEIRAMLREGRLGFGHGKALLSISAGQQRLVAAGRAAEGGWSVRRLEDEARGRTEKPSSHHDEGTGSVEMQDLEKRLGAHLGTKVRVHAGRNGHGTLVIRFFGLDHFDDLMSRIGYRETDAI